MLVYEQGFVSEKAEITIENLLSKIKYYYADDAEVIMRAFELANVAHASQFRASGRPYITHPVVVADILVDMGMDVAAICAALLHDTVEDTYITEEMLKEQFGLEVAKLVKGVTKLEKIQFKTREDEQAENIRKMFLAMSEDIRVLIIKLADRLHNMRSLHFLPAERQQTFARETIDIFAPLAGRLGISPVKCELEDLSLKYLDHEAYVFLSQNLAMKKDERQNIVNEIDASIRKALDELGIEGEISGRSKHFYSIYKKMKKQGKTLEQIYDLSAMRVIVKDVKDCYGVLGAIHALWKPIPGRVKDYISAPKPNLYQSLHTTVITDKGMPFEIQIRTREMHLIAEYGIAAHWKYKEQNISSMKRLRENLNWVDEVIKVQNDLRDSNEFLDIIRTDMSVTNQVYVFTPKGDVRSLIAGATPLDFAFLIHSEVGTKCIGAKINGRIAPMDTTLQNGDTVEILTNPNSKGPSRDWLKILKTSSAKAKVRQFFKRELKDENIKQGKSMLEREAKQRGFTLSALMTEAGVKAVRDRYLFTNEEEIYASVGYGSISAGQVLLKLISQFPKQTGATVKPSGKQRNKENSVIIKGFDDLLVRFSRCCAPVPGDEITGYISRGRGITLHRSDCSSLKGLEKERIVEAHWSSDNPDATFVAHIQVVAEDKGEIFATITKAVANEKLPLIAINARKDKNHNAVAVLSVEISSHEQLDSLISKLRSMPFTIDVFRTSN